MRRRCRLAEFSSVHRWDIYANVLHDLKACLSLEEWEEMKIAPQHENPGPLLFGFGLIQEVSIFRFLCY